VPGSTEDDPALFYTAITFIEAFLKDYGSESNFTHCEGRFISQEETSEYYSTYIKALQLEDYLELNFTKNAIAPTSITHTSSKKSRINICVPIDYTLGRI